MIRLRLLGPPTLLVDGEAPPPELLWRKHLALLVYLHCTSARGATRAHLLDLLWGDKPEAAARHSLNEALRVIRRGLGDDAVDTAGDRVRLVAPVESDLRDVEALLAGGDLTAASAQVGGEFLEGFDLSGAPPFEDWVGSQRVEWRRRGSDLLADAAERDLARGDAESAARLASRAATLDPASPRAVAVAMRAMALVGDRAGALAHHDRLVAALAEAGGVEPPSLGALASRIRAGRSRPADSSADAGQRRRTPLVGREESLAALLAQARASQDHGARVALIRGEPGTGKSRLLEELISRAALEGTTTLALRAVAGDRTDPGGGLRALIAGPLLAAPGVGAAPGEALAAMAAVDAAWLERFPGARERPPSPLRQAVVELVRAATGEAPVILAVDDAQWLDEESLGIMFGLLRDLATSRLLIVTAASPRPEHPSLDELATRIGRDHDGIVLPLPPLSSASLEHLVRWALPGYGQEQTERLTRRIEADSAGLPFLAVELLHAMVGGLDLLGSPHPWPSPFQTLDQTRPGDLPDAIVAAIRIDFRRLTAAAQAVLAAAAVLGDRITANQLTIVTGLPPEAVDEALDELEWHRWLHAEPRGYSHVARIAREVIDRDLVTAGQRRRYLERADAA